MRNHELLETGIATCICVNIEGIKRQLTKEEAREFWRLLEKIEDKVCLTVSGTMFPQP